MRAIVLQLRELEGDRWNLHLETWDDPTEAHYDCEHLVVPGEIVRDWLAVLRLCDELT